MEEFSGIFETFYWILAVAVAVGGGLLIEKWRNKKYNKKAH